jgi:Rap1a immunity proteins
MKSPLLLCLALALPECLAQPAKVARYAGTLTGDEFVRMMKPAPHDGYEYMQREKAYSYLNGARDGAEGRVWCDVDQLKTPDLAYEMAEAIAKLPAAERKKNASLLLLDQLKRHYPCRNGGK